MGRSAAVSNPRKVFAIWSVLPKVTTPSQLILNDGILKQASRYASYSHGNRFKLDMAYRQLR